MRNINKLEKAADSCHQIDEYFPVISKMEQILKDNLQLKEKLVLAMKTSAAGNKINNYNASGMLGLLLDCAKKNAGRKRNGKTYSATMKELGTLIFVLGGPLLYSILLENLGFPSLTTVRRKLFSKDPIKEGYFRGLELKNFLEERDLPFIIWLSEDGTRVNGRVQYDLRTNQIIGFVPPLDKDGLPTTDSFPATSAAEIKSYYDKGVVSSNAYLIVAQPLSPNAPSFCLCLYGTDNSFTAADVSQRWSWTKHFLEQLDIKIAGFSGDGDSKVLSAMYSRTFTQSPATKWPWFNSHLENKEVMIQDIIHLLIKLRGKLTKPSVIIPMGKQFVASRGHIAELIQKTSKDQHLLTMGSIDVKDKMNFRSAQKLCDERVSSLLRSNVAGSEGTATYLDMMRELTNAFLDPQMQPLERIMLFWKWTFFLRFLRKFIENHDGYSLLHNFITANAYTCIEINAHGLIQIIRNLRDLEQHELFLPWLFSSQPCEESFRRFRSQTSTYSTVVNFSILELTHRVRRTDFLAESFNNLKDVMKFPQSQKLYKLSSEPKTITAFLPEDFEIEQTVNLAFKAAKTLCVTLGLVKKTADIPLSSLKRVRVNEVLHDMPNDEVYDEELLDDENEKNGEDGNDELSCLHDEENDVSEDLLIVSTGQLKLKTFQNDLPLSPSSPFVLVQDGSGEVRLIKKTTLVWLLNSGDTSMSSDRIHRVRGNTVSHRLVTQPTGALHKEKKLMVGDWCAFTSEDNTVAVGRILAFSYLFGSTWKNQEYSALSAPVEPPKNVQARGIGCLCTWFKIVKNGKLQPTSMDVHGYYNIDKYICSLPRPDIVGKDLFLRCSLKDIEKLKAKN
ncbi:Phosphoserine aminotransferase [Frankliniella fusca]|uniref:Phosphoserine aminotransferase n=1 Tax=Frankliniella fusca TaxID=407009 RepID=A0AAE1LHL1_9NEOP|nr:Phosphoserine aminotransferase [Frankliniella fusca]